MKNDSKKYVTVEEGTDFRTIAKIMTKNGYKMNHATARNVLISAIKKILAYAGDRVNVKISDLDMKTLLKDQAVHTALADVLYLAHKQESKQEETNGN